MDWWVRSGCGTPAGNPRTGVSPSLVTLHMRTRDKAALMSKCGMISLWRGVSGECRDEAPARFWHGFGGELADFG